MRPVIRDFQMTDGIANSERLTFSPRNVYKEGFHPTPTVKYQEPKKQLAPPTFSNRYFVTGVLSLPYAEIKEPFTAWYDAANEMSRIDYYGDMVQTYQRADEKSYGNSYKVTPMTNEIVKNVKSCFRVNGTANATVAVQSILPDTTGFVHLRNDTLDDDDCEVWHNVTVDGGKVNRYTLWLRRDAAGAPVPLRYEMRGYDTLLGSHYDKYEIAYADYDASPFNPAVFDVPAGLTCGGFPGPGVERRALANPMREYVAGDDAHAHESFTQYRERHGRRYDDEREHKLRKHVFRNNLRFIHSTNRANLGYQLAVNHLADRTDDELRATRGRLTSPHPNGKAFDKARYKGQAVPDSLDWRINGAVTPVKDQAVCGSCWSFGSTGAIEGALFVKTGQLVRLSQQNLMDCSWGYGNNACDGGEEWRSYEWAMKHGGIMSEDDYGSYIGQNGYCSFNPAKVATKVSGYVNVTSGDQEALKLALVNHGPVAVGIDASHKSLSFYANGVYYEPACGNTSDDLDHAVLAVGYGTLNGQPYWLIKNSWSTYWGNDGYVLMSQKDNNCGVATDATFVTI
ncbi:PREDICTED: digestive cysteine proteinase 1-like [Priapulus caudatus]|uniref:Digestive cysteine proteinase 1-like n=1 Tax=Priapulus caudatus TaxID=37621 RepID=A0ABM1E431_PRICU|nr:PREDICTED: digestive cysteine proteinase 1-like [Priapulus caudatus]